MNPVATAVYLAIGFSTGLMSGMFGIGGGSVRIPLLNLAGMRLIDAFGANILVIPFSSLTGAISHRKNLNRRIVLHVIIGGSLGSVAGAVFAGAVSKAALALLFLLSAVVTVAAIYLERISPKTAEKIRPTRKNILGLSFLLSLITALRGGSGGSLFPPFLKSMKLSIHEAIATSLAATVFTGLFATLVYWSRGNIPFLPTVTVLAGSIGGAAIGSKLSLKSKPEWLEAGLSVLILLLSLIVVYKAV